MKHPTFAIVVTFQIKPDCIANFLHRVQQQAGDSVRLEEGCIQFDVLVDEKDSTIVVLYETYVDSQAFVVHRETSHFAQFYEMVTPWVQTKEVRRLTLMEGV